MLREIGAWLSVNGEAIYGTRPLGVFGEGPTEVAEGSFSDTKRKPFTSADVRFTTREGRVYAIVLAWPADGRLSIRSLGRAQTALKGEIRSVELVGSKDAVRWRRDGAGLHVELPKGRPSEHALALRIATR
jgi:alpha-L-fucosidase